MAHRDGEEEQRCHSDAAHCTAAAAAAAAEAEEEAPEEAAAAPQAAAAQAAAQAAGGFPLRALTLAPEVSHLFLSLCLPLSCVSLRFYCSVRSTSPLLRVFSVSRQRNMKAGVKHPPRRTPQLMAS